MPGTPDTPRYDQSEKWTQSVNYDSDRLIYNVGDCRASVCIREGGDPYPHAVRIGLMDDNDEVQVEFDEDEARDFANAILERPRPVEGELGRIGDDHGHSPSLARLAVVKVTTGRGSPHIGHRNISVEPGSVNAR